MHESTVTPKKSEQKYKPVITPARRRGGNFHGGGSFGNCGQGAQNVRDNQRNQNNGTLRPRVRILIIGVKRDMVQTQIRTLNQVKDLGAGTGLTTGQMYDVL